MIREQLQAEYARARATTEEHAIHDPPAETCRYCGKWWRKWQGSKLDGHSACMVTREFKNWLTQFTREHWQLTYAQVAQVIGVTPAVLRSWVAPSRASVAAQRQPPAQGEKERAE